MPDLFTIGHSTHLWHDFVHILDRNQIDLLVDVRSHPGSRRCPQFNQRQMQRILGERYFFMGDTLGGSRQGVYAGAFPKQHIAKQRELPDDLDLDKHPTWTNLGLYEYGLFMAEPQFRAGLEQLARIAAQQRAAIMCAELLWWKCHRASIADAWEGCGGQAFHLWPTKQPQRHVLGNRLKRYEKPTRKLWTGRSKFRL